MTDSLSFPIFSFLRGVLRDLVSNELGARQSGNQFDGFLPIKTTSPGIRPN